MSVENMIDNHHQEAENSMKTPDATLISALAKLANDIQCDDGIANACIAEAAQRLREHGEELERLKHERSVYIGGLEAIQEENARLRDALEDIQRLARTDPDVLPTRLILEYVNDALSATSMESEGK